ncbi:protein Abitram [Anabrus simplex]|uniref:protein Abitram n=1 Tax=Anabrus simplex TaxID=316456 RepID=UPI0034DDB929
MEEAKVNNRNQGKSIPIEDSIGNGDIYQSVTERYYTPRYVLDAGNKKGEDHCILFHSNRICLITLAESHPIIKEKKSIVKIDFHVSTNVDRLKNKVTGKGKHGAQFLQASSPLCFIECTDNTKYTVYSCIKGKLVEMNDALIENPKLLIDKPSAEGYIAIVLPNITNSEQQKEEMLTREDYRRIIEKREAEVV